MLSCAVTRVTSTVKSLIATVLDLKSEEVEDLVGTWSSVRGGQRSCRKGGL